MAGTLYPVDGTGAPSYTAQLWRHLAGALWQGKNSSRPFGTRSGLTAGTSGIIAVTSTEWTVHPCCGAMDVEASNLAGPYVFEFGADQTGPMTAADATQQRVDSLSVQMNDPTEGDPGSINVHVQYTEGTPGPVGGARGAAGGPPTVPSHAVEIAQIQVPASGGGSPSVLLVPSFAVALGGVTPVPASGTMPASPYVGEHADSVDMGGGVRFNGTGWVSAGMGVATVTDCNTATDPGMYFVAAGGSHSPNSANDYAFQTVRNPLGTTIVQTAHRLSTTNTAVEQWERIFDGSTWGAWVLVKDNAQWTNLTLDSGFAANTFGYTPAYKLHADGAVEMRGNIKKNSGTFTAGGTTTLITTLPTSITPASQCHFSCASELSGVTEVRVALTGGSMQVLMLAAGTASWVSLDGIKYWIS